MEVPPGAGTLLHALLWPQEPQNTWVPKILDEWEWFFQPHCRLQFRHFCKRKLKKKTQQNLPSHIHYTFLVFPFFCLCLELLRLHNIISCSHHLECFCDVSAFASQLFPIQSSSSVELDFERSCTHGILEGDVEKITALWEGIWPGRSLATRLGLILNQSGFHPLAAKV